MCHEFMTKALFSPERFFFKYICLCTSKKLGGGGGGGGKAYLDPIQY